MHWAQRTHALERPIRERSHQQHDEPRNEDEHRARCLQQEVPTAPRLPSQEKYQEGRVSKQLAALHLEDHLKGE